MSEAAASRRATGVAGERSGPGGSRLRVRTVEILPGEVCSSTSSRCRSDERYVHLPHLA